MKMECPNCHQIEIGRWVYSEHSNEIRGARSMEHMYRGAMQFNSGWESWDSLNGLRPSASSSVIHSNTVSTMHHSQQSLHHQPSYAVRRQEVPPSTEALSDSDSDLPEYDFTQLNSGSGSSVNMTRSNIITNRHYSQLTGNLQYDLPVWRRTEGLSDSYFDHLPEFDFSELNGGRGSSIDRSRYNTVSNIHPSQQSHQQHQPSVLVQRQAGTGISDDYSDLPEYDFLGLHNGSGSFVPRAHHHLPPTPNPARLADTGSTFHGLQSLPAMQVPLRFVSLRFVLRTGNLYLRPRLLEYYRQQHPDVYADLMALITCYLSHGLF